MNHESFFIENVTRANCQRNGVFEAAPFPAPEEEARGGGRERVTRCAVVPPSRREREWGKQTA
ncbi:hypothetical protein D3869_24820 (plasmid) [Azospirillum brasilense]|uniref:Uncharacterized protein n=1 Tax=Azospirillum brasilense TaxID=192 RepID=A0A4D8R6W4_AZOBR|nr:hypothetical protein D3869_24820 [Azospirillum brasilense]